MLIDVSTFVEGFDTAFAVITGIGLVFLIGITFTLIYFIYKYNKKRHPQLLIPSENVKASLKLEIAWTLIPTILVLVMFAVGYLGYLPTRKVPKDAINIKVTGRMWTWIFDYDNGIKSNSILVVPVNKPIKLNLYSPDVIHSFYIPAFRIKEDVVPGKDNWMWFEADEIGIYDVLCAEYCGTRHSYMLGKLEVVSEDDYLKWCQESESVDPKDQPPGLQLLMKNACVECHTFDGSKLIGPSFKDIFGSERNVKTDGNLRKIVADEEYIKRSIYEPGVDIVEGFRSGMMVSYKDQITEEEVGEIINYLKTLHD